MKKVTVLLCLYCALFSLEALATRPGKKKPLRKGTGKVAPIQVKSEKIYETPIQIPAPVPAEKTIAINSMFGIHVVKGSSLFSGMQFGHRIAKAIPLYFALEYSFSLYSPGSILGFMGGGWYEFPIDSKNTPLISVGVLAGSGFTTDVIATPTTVFLGYLDLAMSQPMDDLFSLRIQLRPGVMYRYLAFMMNLSIAFRFA